MKKFFILCFFVLLFVSAKSFGEFIIHVCFKSEVECPKGEIEDVNHTCRSCLDVNPIELGYCRDKEEVQNLCPNRQLGDCENISFISNPNCPEDQFMGDDGKCYSCDSSEEVKYECIGYEKFRERCPTRPIVGCGSSVKECSANYV